MSQADSMPPDRGQIATEQRHPRSAELDTLSTLECVNLMAEDHEAVPRAVRQAAPAITAFIDALLPRIRDGGRLVYLGAGTSGRLGVLDAAECPPTFQSDPSQVVGVIAGGDSALRRSSEGMEDDPDGAAAALEDLDVGPSDTVLGIAASGTTPYVLGGIGQARARSAMTGLLTGSKPIETPSGCDHLIVLETGPELLTGSTRLKAGSATKLALNIITTVLFTRLGKVYGNLMVDLRASNQKLHDRAIRILMTLHPELSRDAAAGQLEAAGGALKRAIIMQRRQVSAAEAERLLDRAGGNLRDALGA